MKHCLLVLAISGSLHATEAVVGSEPAVSSTQAQSGVAGSTDCGVRVNWLKQEAVGKRRSIENVISDVVRDKSVVILGEFHANFDSIDQYPQLLAQIQKSRPNFNCLFLEAKDPYQRQIDDYMMGTAKYEDTIAGLKRGEIYPLAAARKSVLDFAKGAGIKVFAVDSFDSDRNTHMSDRISKLMGRPCKTAVLIVGKEHVHRRYSSPKPSKPIPDQLRKQGLSVTSINLLSHSELSDSLSNDCSRKLDLPAEDFAFKISGPAPALERDGGIGALPAQWSEYDAGIVTKYKLAH